METPLLDLGLLLSCIGLVVTALSAVLGIWIDRDASKPRRWAFLLSLLVLMAAFGSMGEVMAEARESARLEAEMARILEKLDQLAAESNDPALQEFVTQEVQAQQRANPRVVDRMARRYEARGKDSRKELGRHLEPADLDKVRGSGGSSGRESKPEKDNKAEKDNKPEKNDGGGGRGNGN